MEHSKTSLSKLKYTALMHDPIFAQPVIQAYPIALKARALANIYERNKRRIPYVHATSGGHEAIQIAVGMQLTTTDILYPYYRDDALLLTLGLTPQELIRQLLAKAGDPFSGGRNYYAHTALKRAGFPIIPHQSSGTGMQALAAVGAAQALQYKKKHKQHTESINPLVLCSLGDGAMTEGEVSEALQLAALHQVPIIFLVQDNEWGLSARGSEQRSMDAYTYAAGFKGLNRLQLDGRDFVPLLKQVQTAFDEVRSKQQPLLLHVKVPLLAHHTSGVRKEWYRSESELDIIQTDDPILYIEEYLQKQAGFSRLDLKSIQQEITAAMTCIFEALEQEAEPDPRFLTQHIYAPATIIKEAGNRQPKDQSSVFMVEALLNGMTEILAQYPEAIYFGQDVGSRLGGVFRESVDLQNKFGKDRVFNTPIQEAGILGTALGMTALGLKPIVQIQFADYFWPAMNQLIGEIAKSCYLSNGQFSVPMLIRIPCGAYGGGGPYHSASIESILTTIKGIKIAYPSNAADAKGLLKAAFLDPNPVILLEHKGLYWSKLAHTQAAQTVEPSVDYVIPLGQAKIVLEADQDLLEQGETMVIITYGANVHHANRAARHFKGQVEVIDLRTLVPLDEQMVVKAIKRHGKCLLITEEPLTNSFIESLAGRMSQYCFQWLDAPIALLGAKDLPAIPLNRTLEAAMLPNEADIIQQIERLLCH